MSTLKTLYAFPVFLILALALPGCATSGKCESGGCAGDAKITANVQTQLEKHVELRAPNSINVQTLDHVVYLSGEVSASEFSDIAESVAHGVRGVAKVRNSIAVTH
jgi:osmotically-inducible protein OsmY